MTNTVRNALYDNAAFQVKFAELTLDTFRMLQCLEWEPSGSFYGKQPVESKQHGTLADQSVTSGLIDINLVADMTDSTLPPNPKKAILYRPSVPQLLAVSTNIYIFMENIDMDRLLHELRSGTPQHEHISPKSNQRSLDEFLITSTQYNSLQANKVR